MMRETRSKRLREHDAEASSPAKNIRLESTNAERARIDINVSLGDSSNDDEDWKREKDDKSESDSEDGNPNWSIKATGFKSGPQAGKNHVSVNLDKPGNNPPLKQTNHEEDKCSPPCEPSKLGVTPAVRTSTNQPGAVINVVEKEVTTETSDTADTGDEEEDIHTKKNHDDGSPKAVTCNVVSKLAATDVTSLFKKLPPSVNISLARPDNNNSQHKITTSKQVTVKDATQVQIVPPAQLGVEEQSGNLEAGLRTPDQRLLSRFGAGISVTRVTPGAGTDMVKGGAGKTARGETIKEEVGVAVIDLTDNEENEEIIDIEVYLPVVKNERQGSMDEKVDKKFDHSGLKGEGSGMGLVKSEVKKLCTQRGGLGAAGERGSLGVRKQLVLNERRGWNARRDGGECVLRYPAVNQYSLTGRGNIMPGVRKLQPGERSLTPRGRSAVGVRSPGRGRVLRGSIAPTYGLAGQSPQFSPPRPSAARQRGRVVGAAAGWVGQDARTGLAAPPPRFTFPNPARQMSMGRGTERPAGKGGRLNISNPSVDIRLEIPGDGGRSEVKLVLSKSQVEAIKKLC